MYIYSIYILKTNTAVHSIQWSWIWAEVLEVKFAGAVWVMTCAVQNVHRASTTNAAEEFPPCGRSEKPETPRTHFTSDFKPVWLLNSLPIFSGLLHSISWPYMGSQPSVEEARVQTTALHRESSRSICVEWTYKLSAVNLLPAVANPGIQSPEDAACAEPVGSRKSVDCPVLFSHLALLTYQQPGPLT